MAGDNDGGQEVGGAGGASCSMEVAGEENRECEGEGGAQLGFNKFL